MPPGSELMLSIVPLFLNLFLIWPVSKCQAQLLAPISFSLSQEVRSLRRADQKIRQTLVFSHFFLIFTPSKKWLEICLEKWGQKMRKSWILGSPNPPKIGQKSVLNRPCQKVVIFDKKYGKNYNFSKRWPLILSPWPVFRKLFYEIAFEAPTKFWLEKTIEKPPKNHPQTKQKSMEKT